MVGNSIPSGLDIEIIFNPLLQQAWRRTILLLKGEHVLIIILDKKDSVELDEQSATSNLACIQRRIVTY